MNAVKTNLLPLLATLLLAAACSAGEQAPQDSQTGSEQVEQASQDSQAGSEQVEQAPQDSRAGQTPARIVSLNGATTEILFALGVGEHIVGIDSSSRFPEEGTDELPEVGYYRQLSTEGVLSLEPELVVGGDDAGPVATIEQLEAAGVDVELIGFEPTLEGAAERIRRIGAAVGREEQAEALAAQMLEEVNAHARESGEDAPRVLAIYARGPGVQMVAGTNTPVDTVIRLAGGVNAIQSFEGFQPLTPEAVVAAAPDAILIPADGMASLEGAGGLWSVPGIAQTPAAQTRSAFAYDDLLLLGLTPRLPQLIEEFGAALSEL